MAATSPQPSGSDTAADGAEGAAGADGDPRGTVPTETMTAPSGPVAAIRSSSTVRADCTGVGVPAPRPVTGSAWAAPRDARDDWDRDD